MSKADRPFPRKCYQCSKQEVRLSKINYKAELKRDGIMYTFTVIDLEIPICRACGMKVFTEKVDDQIEAYLTQRILYSFNIEAKKETHRDFSNVDSVGVQISHDGQRVWVCIDGQCVLRVKNIVDVVEVIDDRLEDEEESFPECIENCPMVELCSDSLNLSCYREYFCHSCPKCSNWKDIEEDLCFDCEEKNERKM